MKFSVLKSDFEMMEITGCKMIVGNSRCYYVPSQWYISRFWTVAIQIIWTLTSRQLYHLVKLTLLTAMLGFLNNKWSEGRKYREQCREGLGYFVSGWLAGWLDDGGCKFLHLFFLTEFFKIGGSLISDFDWKTKWRSLINVLKFMKYKLYIQLVLV